MLCDLPLCLPPFLRLLCYAHKKVPTGSLGGWCEAAFSLSGFKYTFFSLVIYFFHPEFGGKKNWEDERRFDQPDNLFCWLISCFDFNELKSNTRVAPWPKKKKKKTLVKSINYSRNQKQQRIWGYLLGHSGNEGHKSVLRVMSRMLKLRADLRVLEKSRIWVNKKLVQFLLQSGGGHVWDMRNNKCCTCLATQWISTF